MSKTGRDHITVILATGNRDKVKELRPLLEGISPLIRVSALHELGAEIEIEETEQTLEGNALLKARTIFDLFAERFTFMIALADDTGLEVDSLNGAPGLYSARFAPMPAGQSPSYKDNINHLLHCMSGKADRSARFRSVIAMKGALPSQGGERRFIFEKTADGMVHGTITFEPRGDGGFGYDPLFEVDSTGKTYSEMSIAEKNSISHRSLAVQKAVTTLREMFEIQNILQTTSNTPV